MAKRRGNNEGTIYQRKDGLWCAQISLNGRRLTKYAKQRSECYIWIRETLGRIHAGLSFDGIQMTLASYVETWLKGKELSRRPKTVEQYAQLTRQHILPLLGHFRLTAIQPAHLQQLYALKRAEGRGDRTVQLIHTTLYNIFKQAVHQGLLERNPAEAVERPKFEPVEMQILSEQQIGQFLSTASGSPFEALFYLALTSGMREGELMGLKWSDIDWEHGILFVQRQLLQIRGQGKVFSPPKTKSGRRQITVGPATLQQLEQHRDRQKLARAEAGERWQEHDLVFPTSIGTPGDYKRVVNEFKRLLKMAELPEIRFHDLRHTSLNSLMEMGMPVNTVQRRAGHSKASTTMNIYGHATMRSQEEAAERIEEVMHPAKLQ